MRITELMYKFSSINKYVINKMFLSLQNGLVILLKLYSSREEKIKYSNLILLWTSKVFVNFCKVKQKINQYILVY